MHHAMHSYRYERQTAEKLKAKKRTIFNFDNRHTSMKRSLPCPKISIGMSWKLHLFVFTTAGIDSVLGNARAGMMSMLHLFPTGQHSSSNAVNLRCSSLGGLRQTSQRRTSSLREDNDALNGIIYNETHISWPLQDDTPDQEVMETLPQFTPTEEADDRSSDSKSMELPPRTSQSHSDFKSECITYLHDNIMPFDIPNAQSLGFPDKSSPDLPDGLAFGILEPTIAFALLAKAYPWTNHVSKDMYYEYVLPFQNVNEARTNWRPFLHSKLEPYIQTLIDCQTTSDESATVEQVVHTVNDHLWTVLSNNADSSPIYFKHGQTPLIYDPMSIITFGYASCTGLSILLVNALRTVGIPARLAGTPAWNGDIDHGNHSWIEFWGSDSQWHIMESLPASGKQAGEGGDLWDPCQWWFCNEEKVKGTSFYAARLDRSSVEGVVFPMGWDLSNRDVVADDRTLFMQDLCSKC